MADKAPENVPKCGTAGITKDKAWVVCHGAAEAQEPWLCATF